MKLNRNGFTLIELLATITILALVSSITIVSVTSYMTNSKKRAEQVFVKELSNIIEDYITLNTTSFTFNTNPVTDTNLKLANCSGVSSPGCSLYKANTNFKLEKLVAAELVTEKDLINPRNSKFCSTSSIIDVYRTGNYNYCFITSLDCYTDDNNNLLEITNCDFERLKEGNE
jgi:prepilin-type N-terminal cleavage/methylation domain-containing protein